MRVVTTQELIRLPVGHGVSQYSDKWVDGSIHIRDHQYVDQDIPANDWVENTAFGIAAHPDGLLQGKLENDQVNQVLHGGRMRHALYPSDEEQFLIYTDGDMMKMVWSAISSLMQMYFSGTDGFVRPHPIEEIIAHIAEEVDELNSQWTAESSVESNAASSNILRRLGMWIILSHATISNEDVMTIRIVMGWRLSHLDREHLKRDPSWETKLTEFLDGKNAPPIATDPMLLRRLYVSPPEFLVQK